jgi:hypothetical protein
MYIQPVMPTAQELHKKQSKKNTLFQNYILIGFSLHLTRGVAL